MRDALLQQGLDLMIYGMSTVIFFLTIMVIATTVLSWVVRRFFPEAPMDAIHENAGQIQTAAPVAPAIYSAIETALKQHRARHKS